MRKISSSPPQYSRPSASIAAAIHSSPKRTVGHVNQRQLTISIRSNSHSQHQPITSNGRKIPAAYRNLESLGAHISESTSKDDGFERLLREANKDPTLLDLPDPIVLLAKEIGSTLFGFMIRSEEEHSLNASMTSLGIDSLINIEVRKWFRQRVEVDFTVLGLVNSE